jgi:hypothetical protein
MTAPIPPPMVDSTGESDLDFFAARPAINSRKRLAFENEAPPGNVAFISVAVRRDAAGLPARIIRAPIYGKWGHT